jgi:hypothetical protein
MTQPTLLRKYIVSTFPMEMDGRPHGVNNQTPMHDSLEDARLHAKASMGTVRVVELEIKCDEIVPGEDYRAPAFLPALNKALEIFKRLQVREPNIPSLNAAIAVVVGVHACPAGALSYQEMLAKFLPCVRDCNDIAAAEYMRALLSAGPT